MTAKELAGEFNTLLDKTRGWSRDMSNRDSTTSDPHSKAFFVAMLSGLLWTESEALENCAKSGRKYVAPSEMWASSGNE